MWLLRKNFSWIKRGDWRRQWPKWSRTLSKRWSWSSCTKLAQSASWTHGLIAQLVRAPERILVDVGSNPTHSNFLYLLQIIFRWWIPYVSVHSATLMWLAQKISIEINVATDEGNGRNEVGHWTNGETGVAAQSWLWVQVELMVW